ncbi:ATP phosphoribosyltransferase regulatory subunit [Hydrocarboniclastica marina]|uniref:ATP phosphoribosyltransferase regulatory subunit n=1 Tax=Hydrocarboniclastica marina TaxID=2259620 RepID=A0A4P7XIP3_9ALTE|nr:ATP phosphoribosyltransferase regulatory subunit [Hydrocarboniclastica marina]QCF26615.1 ATP phosphoribosyltransferase regulatory subunit [Hydrocarboniclastica marina]
MTVSDRWLLPDGVEDLLPPTALRIEALRRELLDSWQRWGYQLISPPMIEYLESLLTGTGNDLDLQTFKLTDQLTGRLMGVRADMTPQAARIDAHGLQSKGVTRLCYAGHVLHTRPLSLTGGRAPLQVGCELFGSSALAADEEIVVLMLEALAVAGVARVHLDLAHVVIYQELVAAAGLSDKKQKAVFDAVRRKSVPELHELLGNQPAGSAGAQLLALAPLVGGREVLAQASEILGTASERIKKALGDLEYVADRVSARFPDVSLGFDFCELRGYNYHTGLVFAAFGAGGEQALAQGGRYDAIGEDFGRGRPATGFSADLRRLTLLADSSDVVDHRAIYAPAVDDPDLQRRVSELRRCETVIQALPDEDSHRARSQCDRQLVQRDGKWHIEALNAQ